MNVKPVLFVDCAQISEIFFKVHKCVDLIKTKVGQILQKTNQENDIDTVCS